MDLHALRYYPFTENADSIIMQVIEKRGNSKFNTTSDIYIKTSVNFILNKHYLDKHISYSTEAEDIIYKYIVVPYQPWLQYSVPLEKNEIALTVGLHEETKNGNVLLSSKNEGIYGFIGKQNVAYLLDEMFGDVDLFQDKNDILFLNHKGPLTKKNMNHYNYYVSSKSLMDSQLVYEIVFFPKDYTKNAFTGYLYVTADEKYHLKRAFFSINNTHKMNFIKDVLLTQTFEMKDGISFPEKKDYVFTFGDETKGAIVVNRKMNYSGNTEPLTASEKQVENVAAIASKTTHFSNLKNAVHFLLTDHYTLGGENGIFEWGPIFQALSYNEMEGVRFRLGGNTTLNLHKHWLLGGYLAYGTKDEKLKYRGDIIYSFLPKDKDIWEFPKRLFRFTYIHDLNIPGHDLLTTRRDRILYSISHSGTHNMSLQKLASINYEQEWENRFSFKIGGKYLFDQPVGSILYVTQKNDIPSVVPAIKNSEISLSLRYSPREAFLQNREKRIYFRRGDIELDLEHKIGLKGLFGSEYHYHKTSLTAYKSVDLSNNIGKVDFQISGGKVWNRVPFPLLFIPSGNQSYIYEPDNYNLLHFYEFVTDNFVSGDVNFLFNWSPFDLLSESKIKTSIGTRMIYGPLSDNNNPELHPELFAFNQGIKPLGQEPYVEMNIGLVNILKLFRLEWVQRLTYLEDDLGKKKNKGSIFVTTSFSF